MKISLIVPVYNVRNYLADAIASVRAQTSSDYECILVDDGSTDGSGALCDELAAGDARFRVIHQPNRGQSAARNAGLDAATGKAIAFLDSDDRLEPTAFETLAAALENDRLDVAIGNVMLHDLESGETRPYAPLSTSQPRNVLDEFFNVSPCNKLYRRAVFATRRFPVGKKFEDVHVWADILLSGAKVGYVDAVVYHYNVNRAGSTVTTGDFREYPTAWEAQRDALKAHGRFVPPVSDDFIARIAIILMLSFVRASSSTRRAFYLAAQRFFRECEHFGLSHERSKAVAIFAWLQAKACARLPYAVYFVLFAPQFILRLPLVYSLSRKSFGKPIDKRNA